MAKDAEKEKIEDVKTPEKESPKKKEAIPSEAKVDKKEQLESFFYSKEGVTIKAKNKEEADKKLRERFPLK